MKYIVSLLFFFIVIIASVTLGMQNEQTVEFNFLIAKGNYSLPVLLAIFLGAGFMAGWLLTGMFYIRVRYRLMRKQGQIKKLEKQLKTIPITQEPIYQPIEQPVQQSAKEIKNPLVALPSQTAQAVVKE